MSVSNNPYPPLQRRMRRRSDQVSPTSPSFTRRFNRFSDALSPTDGPALNYESDNAITTKPYLSSSYSELNQPPSTVSATHNLPSLDQISYQRASEEIGRPRIRTSDEAYRPATSAAAEVDTSYSHRTNTNVPEFSLRPSPVTSQSAFADFKDRRSFEPPIRPTDNSSSPNLRNYSFPAQDRYSNDDHVSSKISTAKKSRLNLLNPMSLLARRRSSQNQKLEEVNLTINTLSVPALPDNFDPSIRGKVVHDFSAPRSRRQISQTDIGLIDSPSLRPGSGTESNRSFEPLSGRLGPLSGISNVSHSPMFKEHFQDDRPTLQPERTGYLHNPAAFNLSHDAQDPRNLPAFAKKLPSAIPYSETQTVSWRLDKENLPIVPLSEPSPPPPTPPPKSTPSPKFDPPPPAALPKHMTSTSSRFSFQIGGGGSSAQEKLLEEKHKQHQATRKSTVSEIEGEDDDYANYDFDADDGLEEEIPSFNADLYRDDGYGLDTIQTNALVARYGSGEDDGFDTSNIPQGNAMVPKYGFEEDGFADDDVPPGNALEPKYKIEATSPASSPEPVIKTTTLHRQSLQGFHFTPQSMTFSPTSTNNASQPTPRDHEGFAIGIADSRESSRESHDVMGRKDNEIDLEKLSMLGGLGITSVEGRPRRRSNQVDRPHAQVFDDEELYFDDGEFGDLSNEHTEVTFDEQIFDDESGKIRDIPAENARKLEIARRGIDVQGEMKTPEKAVGAIISEDNMMRANPMSQFSDHQRQISESSIDQVPNLAGLTETNLAAYHDALALAANQAAVNGRFDRKVSFSQNSDDTSQSLDNSRRGIVSADSRFSFNYNPAIAEDDGFPFDDDMDDEQMIAEANAEALENDEDGFYGQEFGFYARSNVKSGTEIINGGYFGERGSSGVKRSHSGKANFQEPSLTPITERSEWSTRNSVVSLQMPGGLPGSAQSIPSPGIAQLLELDSPSYDDDMNFSALMRLRGRAFGGSSSSLNSAAAGPHQISSPLAHVSHHSFGYGDHNGARLSASIHGRSSPVTGIPESEEEDEEEDRPTVTQNTPRKKVVEPAVYYSQEELPSPPSMATGERRRGHHSRNSSGPESVSYQRETDGRWLLERRRTDEETGDETVNREYLAEGRI